MIEAPSTVPAAGARMPHGQRLRRGLAENPLMVAGGLMCVLIVAVALHVTGRAMTRHTALPFGPFLALGLLAALALQQQGWMA